MAWRTDKRSSKDEVFSVGLIGNVLYGAYRRGESDMALYQQNIRFGALLRHATEGMMTFNREARSFGPPS